MTNSRQGPIKSHTKFVDLNNMNKKYDELLGKIVRVDFLDHSDENGTNRERAIHCRAYGRVRNINKHFIQIWTWELVNEPSEDGTNENTFKILKGCILEIKVLR